MSARPELTIVVPAYNESARLPDTLARLDERFGALDAELVIVDDGSSDDTAAIAERARPAALVTQVIRLPENRGKGAAVRRGVEVSRGVNVLYMDADLATDLGAVDDVLARLERADIVVGSRAVPGARVHSTTVLRTLMGRTFNGLVRMITRLDVHDSQCGFKAYRGDVARLLFALSDVDGFAFDPEVLLMAQILGYRIEEVPVDWTAVDGSSVRPMRDSLLTGWSLLGIARRRRPATVRAAAASLGWQASSEAR